MEVDPLIKECNSAITSLDATFREVSHKFRPDAHPRYKPSSYLREKFEFAIRQLILTEIEIFRVIEFIVTNRREGDELLVEECRLICELDYPLWSIAKSLLPTYLLPEGAIHRLIINSMVRELVQGHTKLVRAIKASTTELSEILGAQAQKLDNILVALKWLFRVFAIYPRARSEYLHELRAAGKDILETEGIDIFYDAQLFAGEIWNQALQEVLESSDVVIALLSEEFFASKYIEETELRIVGERLKNSRCALIPLLFEDCKWDMHPLIRLIQLEPSDHSIRSLYPSAEERHKYFREKLIKCVIVRTFQELSNRDSAKRFIESLQRRLKKELENS